MAGNDLQLQISADVGKALAGISSVETRLRQIEKAAASNNRATQEFQNVTSRAFREASGHAGNFFEQMKEGGHALRFLGGFAGEAGHKVSLLSRFMLNGGAAFGSMGAAAAAAAAGFEIYNHVIEESKEKTRQATEIAEKYQEALKKGEEERSKGAATAGLSQADTIRKLNGVGGHQALKQAEGIAKELGIPLEEARKGLLKSYGFKDEKERGTAIDAAKLSYLSGYGDFGSFFDAAKKSGGVRNLLRQGNAQAAAGEVGIKELTGHYAANPLAAENAIAAGLNENGANTLLGEARYANNVKNETQNEQERRAARGEGRDAILSEAGKALDPIRTRIAENTTALLKLVSAIEDPYKARDVLNAITTGKRRAQSDAENKGELGKGE